MLDKIYLLLAALLLICLIPGMPYGYFTLVRLLSMVGFSALAFKFFLRRNNGLAWTFITLALLFQPFAKVGLGRTFWNVIDVIVAVGLIILFFMGKRLGKQKDKIIKQIIIDTDKEIENYDNNQYEFRLEGLLAPKELVYVASKEDEYLTNLFETKPDIVEGWGQMIGFHIIYLPLLMKQLKSEEVIRYRAPYLTETKISSSINANSFLLQYLEHPEDIKNIGQGFIRTEDIHRGADGRDKAINRFYPLSSKSSEPLADQLHRIGKQIAFEKEQHERLLTSGVEYDHWDDLGAGTENADDRFNSQLVEEDINDLIDEVKERISKLRKRGISQYILEQLVHPDDRLTRLIIKEDYRIFLPDYNNMEIKMEPLVKAVYFLFLNHPEGIPFKRLPDYREELTNIYIKLKPYGMNNRVMQSIEDVTNPLLNSINEKCARIRGAFVERFDDHMAKYYYIDGLRGQPKKISLPRDLVVWE